MGKLEAPDPLPSTVTVKYYRPQVGTPEDRFAVYTEEVITEPRRIGGLLRHSLGALKLYDIEQILDADGTVLRDTTDTETPRL